jgi:hypothetical protein
MFLIELLGSERVFVSIYESHSTDRTALYLRQLKRILRQSNVNNRIISDDFSSSLASSMNGYRHRIEFLAEIRNRALEPLFTHDSNHTYSRILFINDVIFTAEQMLELLRQSWLNDASITCGMDFDYSPSSGLRFYDYWVARDIDGNPFSDYPLASVISHEESNRRYLSGRPFQVQCCWNGAAVLDTKPFLPPFNLRFRREESLLIDGRKPSGSLLRSAWDRLTVGGVDGLRYKSCSGSECSTLCNDFQRKGFHRALIVPRVKLSYNLNVFRELQLYFNDDDDDDDDDDDVRKNDDVRINFEKIKFKPPPKSVSCHPMENRGSRHPDGWVGRLFF